MGWRHICLKRPKSHSVQPQIPLSLPQDPCPGAWERESIDSRDSSRSSWTRLPGSTPMEAEEAESSRPQNSVVSSVVVKDNTRVERPAETSRTRYLEKIMELDLEDLECRQELERPWGSSTCHTRI